MTPFVFPINTERLDYKVFCAVCCCFRMPILWTRLIAKTPTTRQSGLFLRRFGESIDRLFPHNEFGLLKNRASQLNVAIDVHKLFFAVAVPNMDPIFNVFGVSMPEESEAVISSLGSIVIDVGADRSRQAQNRVAV